MVVGLVWGGVVLATGSGCAVAVDAAVDPPGSIQVAVDAASPGDHVCLTGTFAGEPTVTIATSGITIRAGSEAVLDGGTGPAFSFAGGVHHVTIRDLEIRDRLGIGGEAGTIDATAGPTSHVEVRNVYIHDNNLNGIWVDSQGDFVHSEWKVVGNVVVRNVRGIRLTNVTDGGILDNYVNDHLGLGILVGAQNLLGPHVSPVTSHVDVLNNDVGSGSQGIHLVASVGELGGSARLTRLTVEGNHSHNNRQNGIRVTTFNPGATVDHVKVLGNSLGSNEDAGISVRVVKVSGFGTVTDNLIQGNTSTDNGGAGYEVFTDTGRNLFRNNRSNANGGFGYNNVSGPNVYQKNQCQFNSLGGSSPAGLCMPQ